MVWHITADDRWITSKRVWMTQSLVYVQAPDGTPLLPTRRFGKVRRLLKNGEASVVYRKPFTIRLKNEPSGRYTQDISLGIDPGRTNIGTAAVQKDGTCLSVGNWRPETVRSTG